MVDIVDIPEALMSAIATRRLSRPVTRSPEQEQAADRILEALHARLIIRVNQGIELTRLGDPGDVADQIIDRLPLAVNPWSDIVGPVYESGSLQRELGVGRQAVSKAVRELRVLRLETADGHTVYPAFQVRDGRLVSGMQRVLTALRNGIDDPWTWAQWLNAPVSRAPSEPPRRNIDRLVAGDVDAVARDAERTAASWAA
ncbi:hypothetical protein RS85_00729 [Microbacterium sp. SA39]|nr:hypothetical protein RS85_00729 [Microbacterium sp. SA39]